MGLTHHSGEYPNFRQNRVTTNLPKNLAGLTVKANRRVHFVRGAISGLSCCPAYEGSHANLLEMAVNIVIFGRLRKTV